MAVRRRAGTVRPARQVGATNASPSTAPPTNIVIKVFCSRLASPPSSHFVMDSSSRTGAAVTRFGERARDTGTDLPAAGAASRQVPRASADLVAFSVCERLCHL